MKNLQNVKKPVKTPNRDCTDLLTPEDIKNSNSRKHCTRVALNSRRLYGVIIYIFYYLSFLIIGGGAAVLAVSSLISLET